MSGTTILTTPEKKRVLVKFREDDVLFSAERQNTTRGRDLIAHTARSGETYFYVSEWSQWQGETSPTWLVSKEEMEERLLAEAGGDEGYLDVELIKKYFPAFFEETA